MIKSFVSKIKFRDVLLYFFVAEHLIIAFVIIFGFLALRSAYANSDTSVVMSRAQNFIPEPKGQIFSKLASSIAPQAALQYISNKPQDYTIRLSENEINSMLFSEQININHVDKLYIALEGENTVHLWVKLKEISTPLVVSVYYQYANDVFEITPIELSLGPVPLPVSWIETFKETIEDSVNQAINKFENEYDFSLTEVHSGSETLSVTAHVNSLKLK